MSFAPGTAYADDWRWHDFVEDADYESPPGHPKRSLGGLKAKLADLTAGDIAGLGGGLGLTTDAHACVLWSPDDATVDIESNGELRLAESGSFAIRSVRKSRFGHWELTVERMRENAGPS